MGKLTTRCNTSLPIDSLNITTRSTCNITSDYSCINASIALIFLPNLGEGTLPLADIFWYCGGDRVRKTTRVAPEWQV